jgi:hypothetical protein
MMKILHEKMFRACLYLVKLYLSTALILKKLTPLAIKSRMSSLKTLGPSTSPLLSKGFAANRKAATPSHPIKPKPGLMGAPARVWLARDSARHPLTRAASAGMTKAGVGAL